MQEVIKSKQIEMVPIDKIIDNPRNNNIHSKEQIDRLKKIIEFNGFRVPLIVSKRSGFLICGHGRKMAAKELGITELPVVYQDFENEAEEFQFLTADNEISRWAEFDKDQFDIDLKELGLDDDFDLELFGLPELDIPVEILEPQGDEDAVPELKPDPIAKRGDVWILGNHRLMCGDSTMIDDVEKLMDGKKSNMVFTDPPYLMNFTGAVNADGSKSFGSKHGAIKNDKMSREDGDKFLYDIVSNIKIVNEGAYYICFYRLGMDYVLRALDENDLKYRAMIVWYKKGGTLSNSDYKSNYEPIFYGWVNDHKFYGGKAEWDFWDISKTKKNDLHPTMKPVELCERAIKNSSQINGIVLDLFGGGGSTLIASEKNNRNCYMMELDEQYVDVIIKRWQDYTGKDAILEASGETYNSMVVTDG